MAAEIELHSQFWEIEQGNDYQVVDVQGRPKEKLSFWKEILKALASILECLREGYKLPLLSIPPPFSAKNQKSALENVEFVSSAKMIYYKTVA